MLTTTPQCQPQWYQIPRFHYHLFYFSLQGLTNSKCILNKLSIMRFVHILQLPFSQLASCWPARVSLFTSCYYSLTPPSERIALPLRALLPHLIISLSVDLSLRVCAHSYLCLTLIFSFIFHAFTCAHTHTHIRTHKRPKQQYGLAVSPVAQQTLDKMALGALHLRPTMTCFRLSLKSPLTDG